MLGGHERGPRAWPIIFREGDEIMSGLAGWAQRETVSGAHLTAIGAFSSALFGWFDKNQKAYREIPVKEQVECIGLIGEIGLVGSKRRCTSTALSRIPTEPSGVAISSWPWHRPLWKCS
jgi:predicted DNA-binding protein with PD1-like motif